MFRSMFKRKRTNANHFTCILLAILLMSMAYPSSFFAEEGNGNTSNATELGNIETYGNFETAGIDLKFNHLITDETASVFYKKANEGVYLEGHPFTKYDGNHMATSLFDLKPDTTYDVKIVVDSEQGKSEHYTTVKTKPDYTLPKAKRTVNVVNQNRIGFSNSGCSNLGIIFYLTQPGHIALLFLKTNLEQKLAQSSLDHKGKVNL